MKKLSPKPVFSQFVCDHVDYVRLTRIINGLNRVAAGYWAKGLEFSACEVARYAKELSEMRDQDAADSCSWFPKGEAQ